MDGVERWWREVLNLPVGHIYRRYKAISTKKNCDAMTVEGLLAGGLRAYGTPPANLLFQGTNTLVEWCITARNAINDRNFSHHKLYEILERNPDVEEKMRMLHPSRRGVDVPSNKDWKKASSVKWGRRHSQVAMIDYALSQYNRIRDNNINSEQLYWLGGMENIIYNHLTTKPKSDRRTAILCLAWVTMARSEDLLKESPNIVDSVDWH